MEQSEELTNGEGFSMFVSILGIDALAGYRLLMARERLEGPKHAIWHRQIFVSASRWVGQVP
jgi:hypothetical protein